jgi:GNAT superfamily N-acetyltransferase
MLEVDVPKMMRPCWRPSAENDSRLHQRQGIAANLIDSAMRWIIDSGMTIAMVETGGDPGHAPARATYENAGFTLFPISRYFKAL